MSKLTAKAIRAERGGGFIIFARERGAIEWVQLGSVPDLPRARAAILFLQADGAR